MSEPNEQFDLEQQLDRWHAGEMSPVEREQFERENSAMLKLDTELADQLRSYAAPPAGGAGATLGAAAAIAKAAMVKQIILALVAFLGVAGVTTAIILATASSGDADAPRDSDALAPTAVHEGVVEAGFRPAEANADANLIGALLSTKLSNNIRLATPAGVEWLGFDLVDGEQPVNGVSYRAVVYARVDGEPTTLHVGRRVGEAVAPRDAASAIEADAPARHHSTRGDWHLVEIGPSPQPRLLPAITITPQ